MSMTLGTKAVQMYMWVNMAIVSSSLGMVYVLFGKFKLSEWFSQSVCKSCWAQGRL